MILLFVCALLALETASADQVTALCIIQPNSKPPPGTETPVEGVIKMMQTYGQPISIYVEMSGLPPNTTHGFHIHESGDIYTDGCQSTGGHYNPFNHTHGAPYDDMKNRHVGDLGNLVSDGEGRINEKIEDKVATIIGTYSVIGRGFVIHQKRDDLGRGKGPARAESLKTGNAGPRLGCGVIFQPGSD